MMRALPFLLLAPPCGAEVMPMPAGCSPIASVQHRECQVSLYFRCAGQAGYATAVADADGLGWITSRDEGGQWTEMRHLPTGHALQAVEVIDSSDHRSVKAAGQDSYHYTMRDGQRDYAETYQGTNLLVGAVVIDGEELWQVAYDYTVTDEAGTEVRALSGTAYLWGDRPISISGSWRGSNAMMSAAEPVEILTEGEAGFMDMEPRYDCGDKLS